MAVAVARLVVKEQLVKIQHLEHLLHKVAVAPVTLVMKGLQTLHHKLRVVTAVLVVDMDTDK